MDILTLRVGEGRKSKPKPTRQIIVRVFMVASHFILYGVISLRRMASSNRANQQGKETAEAPGYIPICSFRRRSRAQLFWGAILSLKLNPLVLAPHVRHSLGKLDVQRIWLVVSRKSLSQKITPVKKNFHKNS